ncbi:4-hydroxyphenylacetate decarboxylase activating enzyme [uncultured Eubacterium sp.]|nr:4-hydroxyphenylacetate decarboxylase activating enzyme [uncultured Eubacterium sp.]
MKKGTIFNIQKMSIHDGPGIRTTVFFKGCPLNCLWCSNPESQKVEKEVACFQSRCVTCGYCAEVCPKGLIEAQPPFEITNREECDLCEICVKECCTNAKKVVGEDYTVDELLKEIMKDKSFYDSSGGGVTFSGGEPLMQSAFLKEILAACRENGVHTAIETTGMTDTDSLIETAALLDLIFYDVKHMDDETHRDITGVSNERIIANLAVLAKAHDNIVVRIPVIPGINDSTENLRKTADYAASLNIPSIELLPYHNLGEVKYGQLGREYALADTQKPSEEQMNALADEMRNAVGDRNTEITIMKSM